jgi:hypothetical protein
VAVDAILKTTPLKKRIRWAAIGLALGPIVIFLPLRSSNRFRSIDPYFRFSYVFIDFRGSLGGGSPIPSYAVDAG